MASIVELISRFGTCFGAYKPTIFVFGAAVSDRSVLCLLKRREGSMPTQEERLATLERKVAAMELQRLYDERKAAENTPSEQAYNYREINQNLTILLGSASGQEADIRAMKDDLDIIKERVEHIDQRIDGVDRRLEGIDRRLESFEQRFTSLEGKFEQRFISLEGKFEQVLQHLATLTTKLE